MRKLILSLLQNRRLLKEFVVRDLKARYVGSSMGFFWSVVFPIINLLVFMFVFRLILKARWSDHQGPIEVALVMLAGIVVWAAFAETVSRATNSLIENANLIQKVVFPSELLPVYLTISSLINMCIGLPVVMLCVGWFGYLSPPAVEFHATPAPIVEGDEIFVQVHLTRGFARDVTVPFTVEGTADVGTDVQLEPSSVSIPSGRLWGAITVRALRDEVAEVDESVVITLADPKNAVLGESRTLEVVVGDEAPGTEREALLLTPTGTIDQEYRPLKLGKALSILPVLFLFQIIFTAGIGFILATLNVFVRDVFHLVGVFITVWMFSTPIFYPAAMVEAEGYGWILQMNPMYWLIESYRSVLLYNQWPDWQLVMRFGAVGLVALLLGSTFFMTQKRRFPDLL